MVLPFRRAFSTSALMDGQESDESGLPREEATTMVAMRKRESAAVVMRRGSWLS